MITKKIGKVTGIDEESADVQWLKVTIDD